MTPSPEHIEFYTSNLLYRCHGCYASLNNNTKIVVVDTMNYVVMEQKLMCVNCGVQVDYWAHGSWSNQYESRQFESQYPKVAELIRKMAGK